MEPEQRSIVGLWSRGVRINNCIRTVPHTIKFEFSSAFIDHYIHSITLVMSSEWLYLSVGHVRANPIQRRRHPGTGDPPPDFQIPNISTITSS